MRIEALEKQRIPSQVIKRWLADGMRYLLPIQAESVNRYGILRGESVVISGPGTSGKTFCGEMAALYNGALGKKAIFLVPLKAIAEEKHRLFTGRYSPLGIRLALATRDRLDDTVAQGQFDILIGIYEKFNSLTASDISLIRNCGCFILDEFQMIDDSDRGAELELVIAKIRAFNPGAQIVILVGEGSSPEGISRWLGIPCLEENRRPVDLRLGILHRGKFHFRGFNDLREGEESWLEKRDIDYDGPLSDQSLSAIGTLIERGEQVIIFSSTRKSCVNIAAHLARQLNLPRASNSVGALDDLAPSAQNERLGACLDGGVAFHHAELDSEQRGLVEDGFRSGEIKALVATSTLARGVNLPAKNVFIEVMRYEGTRSLHSRSYMVPISVADFHQAAGRAGRLGSKDSFGRAVMVASTPYEREILWDRYVYSRDEETKTIPDKGRFADLIMRLVACGAAVSIDGLRAIISRLYNIQRSDRKDDVSIMVETGVEFLERGDFLSVDRSGAVRSTSLGRITCLSGLSVESVSLIDSAMRKGEIVHPLEWLLFSLELREWMEAAGSYAVRRFSSDDIWRRISELTNGLFDESEYLLAKARLRKLPEIGRAFSEYLFLLEWISGRPTRDLEITFDRGGGGLKRDAETVSWILGGIEKVLRRSKSESDDKAADGLLTLSSRIRYGVSPAMLSLATMLQIDREFIRRLYEMGIRRKDDLFEIDYQQFGEMLPPSVIERIIDRTRNRPSPENSPEGRESSGNMIEFTGTVRNRLREVIILRRSIFLQPKLYSYLRKLWWGSKSDNPWVHKETLEPGFNQAKYISKIRNIFKKSGVDLKIASNGAGSYRLVLPDGDQSPDIGADYEHVSVDGG
jgi:helicase